MKGGHKAAIEWAKNQGYVTIEKVLELIKSESVDVDIMPDEFIHGSKEFQRGFKSALERIFEESEK